MQSDPATASFEGASNGLALALEESRACVRLLLQPAESATQVTPQIHS